MSGNSSNKSIDYFPYFDWLRFALALVVMLGHDQVIRLWSFSGNFAVQVFFALSGWLIGSILINTRTELLPNFYFNRAIRIWVPYFLACIFLISASLIKRETISTVWLEVVFYKITFVYNIFGTAMLEHHVNAMPLRGTGNGLWSVNAEEQFYLIAPIILVILKKYGGQHWLTWFLLSVFALIANFFVSICLGVFAAVLASRFGPIHKSALGTSILIIALVSSSVALFHDLDYPTWAPIAAISIVLLLSVNGAKSQLGEFFGGISYQLYLNHWIGSIFATMIFKPFGLQDSSIRNVVSVLVSITLASVLYWFIDRKLLSMRSDWFTPTRGLIAIVGGYGLVAIGASIGLHFRG